VYLVVCDPVLVIIVVIIIIKTEPILKPLDIARTILLAKFSYIEQHVGLDCGIEQSGKH